MRLYEKVEKLKIVVCSLVVVVVVLGNTRVSEFLLILKHLPTAVYINESDSGWYIKKANAKL